MISPDSIHVNPLHVFVQDCLLVDPGNMVPIGNKDYDPETLYGFYTLWNIRNGLTSMSFKSFSILLIDLLKQLGWGISKIKTNKGFVVRGVKLNRAWKLEKDPEGSSSF